MRAIEVRVRKRTATVFTAVRQAPAELPLGSANALVASGNSSSSRSHVARIYSRFKQNNLHGQLCTGNDFIIKRLLREYFR